MSSDSNHKTDSFFSGINTPFRFFLIAFVAIFSDEFIAFFIFNERLYTVSRHGLIFEFVFHFLVMLPILFFFLYVPQSRHIKLQAKSAKDLKDSEAHYKVIVEDQTERISRFKPDRTLIFVNEAFCKYFNMQRDELIGMNFTPLVHEDDIEFVSSKLSSITFEHPVVSFEYRTLLSGGRGVRWQSGSFRGIFDDNGTLIEYQAVGRDVTERVEAVNALVKSKEMVEYRVLERTRELSVANQALKDEVEQRKAAEFNLLKYSEVVSQSPSIIIITDADGIVQYVNPRFTKITGYTSADVLGEMVDDICKPSSLTSHKTIWNKVRNGNKWQGEISYSKKSGELYWEYIMLLPVLDSDGNIQHLLKVSEDITGRKAKDKERVKRELEFRRLTQQFDTVLNAVPESMVLLSPDFEILWANKRVSSMFGVATDTIVGSKCYEVMYNRTKPCEACPAKHTLQTGLDSSENFLSNDGKMFDLRTLPLKDERGNIYNIVEIIGDVTEQKNLKAESVVAAHLASLGELAAGVAHEINNPINSVLNFAQIIKNHTEPSTELNDLSGRIIGESLRVSSIVNSLLSFARIRHDELLPCKVSEIFIDTVSLTKMRTRREGIEVIIDVDDNLPMIKANYQQIQRLFLNFISNSRFALNTKEFDDNTKKKIEISATEVMASGEKFVRIKFHDNGIGIPEKIKSKILEPFFSSKPHGKGTGLGLSICHGIVSEHSGTMIIDSIEGQYTTVIIDLPALEVK